MDELLMAKPKIKTKKHNKTVRDQLQTLSRSYEDTSYYTVSSTETTIVRLKK